VHHHFSTAVRVRLRVPFFGARVSPNLIGFFD
jgi:hypothetical protein